MVASSRRFVRPAPLTSLAGLAETSPLLVVVAIAYLLLAAWVLAALAFRRAADANVSSWIIPYVIAPLPQQKRNRCAQWLSILSSA